MDHSVASVDVLGPAVDKKQSLLCCSEGEGLAALQLAGYLLRLTGLIPQIEVGGTCKRPVKGTASMLIVPVINGYKSHKPLGRAFGLG